MDIVRGVEAIVLGQKACLRSQDVGRGREGALVKKDVGGDQRPESGDWVTAAVKSG